MVRGVTNTGGVPAPGPQPAAGVTPSVGSHYTSAYPPPPLSAAGDSRYMEQTLISAYSRQDPYQRSLSNNRRPTIMGHYG